MKNVKRTVSDNYRRSHYSREFKKGDLFVLGCTTSEVVGGVIGKNSSAEVGQWIVSTLIEQLDKKASLWLSKDANILIVL